VTNNFIMIAIPDSCDNQLACPSVIRSRSRIRIDG